MSINSPIISALPNNLLNGTPNDAPQVMADFNQILNGVNNNLAAVSANSGASFIGITSDARWLGTSVQDALAQLITNTQVNDTGVVNAIAFTTTPNITALTNNLFVWFKAGNTNTSSTVTIAAGTTAATAVVLNDGSTLPPIGSIISGQIYGAWYSVGLSKWVLINPSRATGSFTITLTGFGSAPTGTVNYAIGNDGKTVIAWIASSIIGTSNATTMAGTGIPNSIKSATDHGPQIILQDGGVGVFSYLSGTNSNTWTFNKGVSGSSGFTNTGQKGIIANITIQAYTLD